MWLDESRVLSWSGTAPTDEDKSEGHQAYYIDNWVNDKGLSESIHLQRGLCLHAGQGHCKRVSSISRVEKKVIVFDGKQRKPWI